MDRGEFIKNGYAVEPGEGGSWVAWTGGRALDRSSPSRMRGFTNWADLTKWLAEEHAALHLATECTVTHPRENRPTGWSA
jgi:hypothetical protein